MKTFNIVDILIWDSLNKAVAKFGIEGTEEKIKELYSQMPKARDLLLKKYNEIYKGQNE